MFLKAAGMKHFQNVNESFASVFPSKIQLNMSFEREIQYVCVTKQRRLGSKLEYSLPEPGSFFYFCFV